MIETQEAQKTVHGNLTGETTRMGIQAEYMGHIMGILTDMYEDRIKAMIREYSTNARDAMVAAGRGDVPIEVTLPSALSPFFTVKDTGIGMDADDIREIYSQYGSSTKRMTNDQVGMLGIGAKSALAYCDQFTLVGVKGGRKVQVAVTREQDGGGSMKTVSDEPTTEANGVEIIIPSKGGDYEQFATKACDFFRYWEPGMVLVNGREPTYFTSDGIHIPGTDLWVEKTDRYAYNAAVIIMGNVPYPATIEAGLGHGYKLVARVPIGAVHFPPSRESLKSDAHTTTQLAVITARFKENAPKAVQVMIDKAASKREAMMARAQWAGVLGGKAGDEYKYKGEVLPHNLFVKPAKPCGDNKPPHQIGFDQQPQAAAECPHCEVADRPFLSGDTTARDWTYVSTNSNLPLDYFDGELTPSSYNRSGTALIVEGYDRSDKATPTVKKKLLQYMDEKDLSRTDYPRFVLVRGKLTPGQKRTLSWVKQPKVIQWADVWAIKLPRANVQTTSGKPQGAYPVATPPDASYVPPTYASSYGNSGRSYGITNDDVAGDDLPSRPVYVEGNIHAARECCIPCDQPVVAVAPRRLEKFLRDFPNARKASDVREARARAHEKTLSEDVRQVLSRLDYYQSGNPFGNWTALAKHAGRIKDPDVLEAIRLGTIKVKDEIAKLSDLGINARTMRPTGPKKIDPFTKYPLLGGSITPGEEDHAVLYINAVYAANPTKGV